MDFRHSNMEVGFVYYVEHIGVDGDILSVERSENILPDAGRDYLLTAALLSGSQYPTFYLGLYETDYTPIATDTMITLLAAVTESMAYSSATRMELVPDALAAGVFSNAGTPALFEFTSSSTVRGGFITSNNVKLNNTGLLLSAELLTSPKVMAAGESLRVTGGISLVVV